MVFKNNNEDIILFRTEEAHEHKQHNDRLTAKTKEEIEKLFDLNIKTKKIGSSLEKRT